MKDVSRRQFLKGALSGTAAVAAVGALNVPALGLAEGKTLYTPGTYSAVEKGAMSTVKVTMTFSETAITDVVVDTSGETAGIGLEEGERLAALLKDMQDSSMQGSITLDANPAQP
ncbi:MAG: twin-arginine translocation signal domain-containing protein [Clostridia bacterium]|nr:twin-arginine translocation signal domain-containing protein [Clostridia bacterium]